MKLVRRLDHVVAVLPNAEAAFRHMINDLGLPEAWPFQDYGGFVSGGVGLGNLNVEFVQGRSSAYTAWPARFSALAFEPLSPVDEGLLGLMKERGVRFDEPSLTPGWTNVNLPGLLDDVHTFICDYHIPGATDPLLRRAALATNQGGALGVVGVAEVVMGVHDVVAATREWSKILGPTSTARGDSWVGDEGPDLRFVDHDQVGVLDVVLQARVRDRAAEWQSDRSFHDPLNGLPLSIVTPSDRSEHVNL